jgi:N-acyl-D-amino-acid deacylase
MKVLSNPRCLIASNAASLSKTSQVILSPERARRTFPKFLSLVETRNIMPIEEAVQRVTETPARLLNLDKRGEIKEGYYADLTGFQGGEVRFTIVNGHIAFEDQELSKSLAGKILRHHTA